MSDLRCDVVICGGGLAGLTLALQLRRAVPDLDIIVVERDPGPLLDGCHKVGESSIELGSHYLDTVLGLRDYLEEHHLRKNGLRFFCGDTGQSIVERMEIGPQDRPPLSSYQLDRGALERHLRDLVCEAGVKLITDWQVVDIELGEGDAPHQATIKRRRQDSTQIIQADWLVDATGRTQLLQRKLDLRRPSPVASSASWFRVGEYVRMNDLVPASEEAWHARDPEGTRWLSTNHLMGLGYWVWLIPLPGGMTSIGIVAETEHHAFNTFDTREAAFAFLEKNEPELYRRLQGVEVEDFLTLAHYSYSTERMFSAQRWSCVGEAGAFVDPLYSAGTDFIGLANTFTTELIKDHHEGNLDEARVEEFNGLLLRWVGYAERMLMSNGRTFTRGEVFATKLWWDFFHYWADPCQYFYQGIYRLPVGEHRKFSALSERWAQLNDWVKALADAWADLCPASTPSTSVFMPLAPSTLLDLHVDLERHKTPAETYDRMVEDLQTAEHLVAEILLRALCSVGPDQVRELTARCRLSEWDIEIDPSRVELDALPRRARTDGLPRVARDMERALGHAQSPVPLSELVDLAQPIA